MLLSIYQRLNDTDKLMLADVFANEKFLQVINQAYLEVQIGLLNLEEGVDENESDTAFRRRFAVQKQLLKDIAELQQFITDGKKEHKALVNALQHEEGKQNVATQ